jgi:cytochrome c oxidase cbb3-type subunit 3
MACVVAAVALRPEASPAQPAEPPADGEKSAANIVPAQAQAQGQGQSRYESTTAILLHTPVSGILPGGVNTVPKISNPAIGNPAAIQTGMQYFNAMNCVGCHAANGGGGMGPALSDGFFQFGGSPANIYLTILQGRSQGMPAWGSMLPPEVIWDLVAYVTQISKAPVTQWGTTISASSPSIQQVPAEFLNTDNPWAFTEPFTYGQRPAAPASGQ